MGLYKPGTHEVIDIARCAIQHDRINRIVGYLRTAIKEHGVSVYDPATRAGALRYVVVRTTYRTKQTLVTFVTATADKAPLRVLARELLERFGDVVGVLQHVNDTPGNAIFKAEGTEPGQGHGHEDRESSEIAAGADGTGATILLAGKDVLTDELAGLTLRASATSFFQVNPPVAEKLYFRIAELAGLSGTEKVLDLYCGVGGISLTLARDAKRVVGVEETPASVQDAAFNARENGLSDKAEFHAGRAEDLLPLLEARGLLTGTDVVTLNPSRRGCQKDVLTHVAKLSPRAIIYMSCSPDTLLRDVRTLHALGYAPALFEPYDMFPGTPHAEVLCVLLPTPTT